MPITDSNFSRSVIPIYVDQVAVSRRARPGGENYVFLRFISVACQAPALKPGFHRGLLRQAAGCPWPERLSSGEANSHMTAAIAGFAPI
jgi:hypothetical protein